MILVALTAGAAVGGIVGAFLAVPLTAMGAAVASEVWERRGPTWVADPPSGTSPDEADGPDTMRW